MALGATFMPGLRATASRPIFRNAASLWGSTLVTSLLGFAFWVAAARLFPIDDVGISSAAMSAMMLLAQFGMLGMGTLLIGELAGGNFTPGLVTAGTMVAGVAAFGLGYAFVALQGVLSTKLGPLGHGVIGPLLFATGTGVTAITLVVDQASIGLNRGGLQLARNGVFSFVKLILLPTGALFATGHLPLVIYAVWLIGNLVSLQTYWVHARRSGINPVLIPAFGPLFKVRVAAFGHHWLNLAFQAPRLLLPVIVSATLSAASTAAFYEANLIVSFVGIIPSHLSTALFALPHGDKKRLAIELRSALRVAFTLAALSAVAFAALAHPILLVFGRRYVIASHSMALLGLSTMPFTVKTHYAAVERVNGRLMRCAAISTVGGLLEAAFCIVGVKTHGLAGVSAGLDVALLIEAIALWPVVARAADIPVLGMPTWLWRPAVESQPPGSTQSDPRALAPGDPVFQRLWDGRRGLSTGSGLARLRSLAAIATSLFWLLRHGRKIRHEQLVLSSTSDSSPLENLMTFAAGPFTAPRPLLSVLDLPDSPADLLPAERTGLRVVALANPASAFAAYAMTNGRTPMQSESEEPELRALLKLSATTTLVAMDSQGRFLGTAIVVSDAGAAYLARLVSDDQPLSGDARRVLHTYVCSMLIDAGVTQLWTAGPLSADPELRRFQSQLGYQCATFRLRSPDEPS